MAAETGEASASSPAQPARTPPLSPWLQLMLAEIARKRAAIEHERAEAARRVLERAAEPPGPGAANPAATTHGAAHAAPDAVLHMSTPQRGS
jgi:hypothetical protein